MASPSTLQKVWFLCIDAMDPTLVVGQPDSVSILPTSDASDLAALVATNVAVMKPGVVPMSMVILRADSNVLTIDDDRDNTLAKKVAELYKGKKLQKIGKGEVIGDLVLGTKEVLIFDINGQGRGILELHPGPIPPEYRVLLMAAHQRGSIAGDDLILNQIYEAPEPNPSVQGLMKLLNRPRLIEDDDVAKCLTKLLEKAGITGIPYFVYMKPNHSGPSDSTDSVPSDSNDNTLPDSNTSAQPNSNSSPLSDPREIDITMSAPETNLEPDKEGYAASSAELRHIQDVLDLDYSTSLMETSVPSSSFDESVATIAVFGRFAYIYRHDAHFSFKFSRYSWDVKILIQVDNEVYSYSPKSDFLFAHETLPRLIVEVQSKSSDDLNRILLQAAYLVKFANTFLTKYKKAKDFHMVTDYIWKTGCALRRIVYQNKDDEAVYYTTQSFDLNDKKQFAQFLCGMYNLASWVPTGYSEADRTNTRSQMKLLKEAFENAANKPGVKPWTVKPPRPQPEGGFSGQPPPSRRQKTHDAVDEFTEQIEARGYVVQRYGVRGYEAEPLAFDRSDTAWEMMDPPNIRTIYQRSDVKHTKPLIAKRVRKSLSHEFEILQHLNSTPSPSPYIIAPDECFTVATTAYLIFPKLNRIGEATLHDGMVKQPCRSLVEGVAYLHANGVAHLDLKLDNLLYDAAGLLKIIDFDIAVRVEDEDEEVVGYRGTPGWTAPEIGDVGGPKRRYSAIKADRWACGRILLTFVQYEHNRHFMALAQKLMANNPNERPSLITWCHQLCELPIACGLQVDSRAAKRMKLTTTLTDDGRENGVRAPPARKEEKENVPAVLPLSAGIRV